MHLRRLQSFESPEIIELSKLVCQSNICKQGSGAKQKGKGGRGGVKKTQKLTSASRVKYVRSSKASFRITWKVNSDQLHKKEKQSHNFINILSQLNFRQVYI